MQNLIDLVDRALARLEDADEAHYQALCFMLEPHHGNADPRTPENRERLKAMGADVSVLDS